jgi:hypothetical protein
VAWLVENLSFSRVRASVLGGVTVWLLGIACLLSLNAWSEVKIFGKGFLDLFDFLTANILLPLGGVLIAIFAGWMLSRASSVDELEMGDGVALPTLVVADPLRRPHCRCHRVAECRRSDSGLAGAGMIGVFSSRLGSASTGSVARRSSSDAI